MAKTITIDGDKLADALLAKAQMILPKSKRNLIHNAIVAQVRDLLLEREQEIFATLAECFAENEKEKFAFPLRVSAKIIADGPDWRVETNLAWGITHNATAETTISGQADMFESVQEGCGK